MASYLDDKTRAEHYGRCRAKKKRYERILDFCMWAALLAGAMTVIPKLFVNGFMNLLFVRNMEMLLEALSRTLGAAVAIYAIYLRKWKITIPATLAALACNIFVALATAVSAVVHWYLHRLSQEEGWPLFDIPYDEQEQRRKNTEKIIRHRAVALGERVISAPTEETAEAAEPGMYDILDERADVLNGSLSGYHDRFRNAQPEDRVNSFEPGVMDTLEDIGELVQPE